MPKKFHPYRGPGLRQVKIKGINGNKMHPITKFKEYVNIQGGYKCPNNNRLTINQINGKSLSGGTFCIKCECDISFEWTHIPGIGTYDTIVNAMTDAHDEAEKAVKVEAKYNQS